MRALPRPWVLGAILLASLGLAQTDSLSIQASLDEAAIGRALALGESLGKDSPGLTLGRKGTELGSMRSDANRSNHWSQQTGDPMATTGFGVEIFTPFTWLARGASIAANEGEPLDPDALEEAYAAPVLRVIGYPNVPKTPTPGIYGDRVESLSLRPTRRKGYQEAIAIETTRLSDTVRAPNGAILDMGPLVAAFPLADVQAISSLDKKGEFYVVVVSAKGKEKKFKVKSKNFDQLP